MGRICQQVMICSVIKKATALVNSKVTCESLDWCPCACPVHPYIFAVEPNWLLSSAL